MQIDHIALYTRDLERLCEFYTKYFDGTAGKLYQNEETGTQACFVSFADGARLEIVTRPQFEDAEHSRLWTGWAHTSFKACMGKGFLDFVAAEQPDMLCLQETKMQPGQADVPLEGGYREYWNSAEKKGYSGVALFTKTEPQSVTYGLGIEEHDHEGRVITADYGEFYLVTVYTPNSQNELKRLDYRMTWEDAFREYLVKLDAEKPVIVCGDMNVAHEEIDLKNPKTNRKNAGFTDEERGKMTELLAAGFTDTFRHFNPTLEGVYSWWSYRFHAREKNAGWRIDYFLVSNRFAQRVKDARILTDVFGSDHCPVLIEIE